MPEKNMMKYETYKTMNENLTRAMKSGFFYEAIFGKVCLHGVLNLLFGLFDVHTDPNYSALCFL